MLRSVPTFTANGEAMSVSLSGPTYFSILVSKRRREAIDKGRREFIPELGHNFGKIPSDSPRHRVVPTLLKGRTRHHPPFKRGI